MTEAEEYLDKWRFKTESIGEKAAIMQSYADDQLKKQNQSDDLCNCNDSHQYTETYSKEYCSKCDKII